MGKLSLGRVLDCFCLSSCSSSCFCINTMEIEGDVENERRALISGEGNQMVRIRDIVDVDEHQTLAFQLKPKIVVLRVSMHCNGCARKVEKHVSKMEGVTSFEVDLENKKVTLIGDLAPFEVLESFSKVKIAQLWSPPC